MTAAIITWPGGSIDLLGGRVLRHGEPVKVEPRAWRVLEQLARFRHRVVGKEELLAALRPEGAVSDGALRQAVRAARRAIGDDGPEPIIRSIPRVGYIFDAPAGPAREGPAARAAAGAVPGVFIAAWRNETGLPRHQWIEAGLPAVLAHGLSLDGHLHVRDAQGLDMPAAPSRTFFRKMLRGMGARYAVSGALRRRGDGFELAVQVHTEARLASFSLHGASAAELAGPALQAVEHHLLGARGTADGAARLDRCSALSIELFARARQAAVEHRHAAALRMLELLNEIEPAFPRLDLELLRAQAICGDDRAQALAGTLLQRAQASGDSALEAQARQSLGSLHAARGQLREAAQSFRQSLAAGRACMPPDWQAHTLVLLASMECRLGEMHSVSAHLDEAQAMFLRIGNRCGLINVLWVRAVLSSLSGNVEQAIAWNRRLAASARRYRAGTALVGACINLALDLMHADRLDEALACAEESSATAQAIESSGELVSMIANVHCLIHRLLRRPDAAEALLAQLPQPVDADDEGYLWMAHAHAAMASGRLDAAADCFQRAASECRRRSNRIAELALLPWLVEALARCGRVHLAQAELDRADAQPHLLDEATTANLLYPRALLALQRQQQPEAQALLGRLASAPAARPLFRRLGQDLSASPVDPQAAPMAPPNGVMRRQHRFASCVLDEERRELWVDGRRQTLAPKPFDVLVHLYRNRHRVVAMDELLDTVWNGTDGSPEVVAQAIAKIRQAVRQSKTQPTLIQTVYGKGYRLLAKARAEPDDDTAASLLADPQATQERLLAVVPLQHGMPPEGAGDRDLAYPLAVIGHTVAVHARLIRLPDSVVQAGMHGDAATTPEGIAAAIREHNPGAHVLFARLTRHGEALLLEYVLVSPLARTAGTLSDPSPTMLGRRLAARLLRLSAADTEAQTHPAAEDAWMTQMLDLASRAAEERRWSAALRILDVILDHDCDHELAADIKSRIPKRSDACSSVDSAGRSARTLASA